MIISDYEWQGLKTRLGRSTFRSRFHLSPHDKEYVHLKGYDTIESHAEDFIRKRLAPSHIPNDGKQTPMKGHPVFIAQHATALCCRGCMEKWHHIDRNHALTEGEIEYATSVIMRFIKAELELES